MPTKEIEPKLRVISDYLKIKDCFVIPEYQREYSWTIFQCDKLWQDIETFLDSGNTDPYFFGTIIIDCSNPDGELHLIDGQQRTTTFLLLIKALLIRLQKAIEAFRRTDDSEALEEGLRDYRNRAVEILYKADIKKRTEILKDWENAKGIEILRNNSINEKFKNEIQNIIESRTFEEAEQRCFKIPRRQKDNKYTNFFRNFKFFYEKLLSYSESRLNEFAGGFLDLCQVIEIRSWKTEQAITMFNSLNSTGLPLSDANIVSAQMYSYAGDHRDEFKASWEEIVRLSSDLSSRNIVNIDSVLQQYMYVYRASQKVYINGKSVNVTTPGLRKFYMTDHVEILKEPILCCQNLQKIASIWDKVKDYPIVRLLLKFNDNAKIFLSVYMYRYRAEDLDQSKIIEVCESLLRLFVLLELVDAGYSSSNFKTFLFAEAIKLVDKGKTEDEIVNDFNNHIQKVWEKENIKQLIREYDKNILVYLNEYLFSKQKGVGFYFADTVNVEHIMPASGHNIETIRKDAGIEDVKEFDSIVNKIGNKILLEEDINKSIGREWFKTKKQTSIKQKLGYKDSCYNIAQSLSAYPSDLWTKEDIEKATNKIADRITDFIWDVDRI